MSFSDYSTTPASNTTIAGINVAENCPPGGINNAIRQLMADGKELSNTVSGLGSYLPLSGGTLTGDITRAGQGAYLKHARSDLSDGRVYFLPEGSALPSPAPGTVVFFYS